MRPEDTSAHDHYRRIEELKYRYVRCLDTKDWDILASLFTDDATASYGGGAYVAEGRDAIMEFLVANMGSESFHSSHTVGQPEIALDLAEGAASGRWSLNDVVIDVELGVFISGAAFYEDTYALRDDRWLIARTGYKRSYEYLVPLADIEHFKLTASLWGTNGRSSLVAG
ncbi:MAG: nuclear transport factor 2 family protein [Microthrixaceae bacterium]